MFFKNLNTVLINLKSSSKLCVRHWSCAVKETPQIKKSVFISQSTDIYTNLALEQWLFKNMDFTHNQVMMLWRNEPCVVIGRHQNPWTEVDVTALKSNGIKLARRESGGGTVYHDLGNLNVTFFTPSQYYKRQNNLEIITRALFREWSLQANINKRLDIVVRGDYKISGTAAKLTRTNSYHHCTLLVNANKSQLAKSLIKKDLGIKSNATKSIPSPILNLVDENRHVTVEKLMSALGWEYLRTSVDDLMDNGLRYASQQNGFKYINPTEGWYPGINKIRDDLKDWNYIYGKTPKFSSNIYMQSTNGKEKLKLSMIVEEGKINDFALEIPPGLSTMGFHGSAQVYIPDAMELKRQQFSETAVNILRKVVQEQSKTGKDSTNKIVVESIN